MALNYIRDLLARIFGSREVVTEKEITKEVVKVVMNMPFSELNTGSGTVSDVTTLNDLTYESDIQEWGYNADYVLILPTGGDLLVGFSPNPKFKVLQNSALGIWFNDISKIYLKPADPLSPPTVYVLIARY